MKATLTVLVAALVVTGAVAVNSTMKVQESNAMTADLVSLLELVPADADAGVLNAEAYYNACMNKMKKLIKQNQDREQKISAVCRAIGDAEAAGSPRGARTVQ